MAGQDDREKKNRTPEKNMGELNSRYFKRKFFYMEWGKSESGKQERMGKVCTWIRGTIPDTQQGKTG